MFQLIYTSRATQPFGPAQLEKLLARSRVNNARMDVTGMLVFYDGFFMQILEGDERIVRALYSMVERDGNHADTRLLLTTHVQDRKFDGWSMGFYNSDARPFDQLPGFTTFFAPNFSTALFATNGDFARRLLLAFRDVKWRARVETGRRRRAPELATVGAM